MYILCIIGCIFSVIFKHICCIFVLYFFEYFMYILCIIGCIFYVFFKYICCICVLDFIDI